MIRAILTPVCPANPSSLGIEVQFYGPRADRSQAS